MRIRAREAHCTRVVIRVTAEIRSQSYPLIKDARQEVVMTTIRDVQEFLAQRRIAMVGVSRNARDCSRALFREVCKRGMTWFR